MEKIDWISAIIKIARQLETIIHPLLPLQRIKCFFCSAPLAENNLAYTLCPLDLRLFCILWVFDLRRHIAEKRQPVSFFFALDAVKQLHLDKSCMQLLCKFFSIVG
jgi:hypothetical protein